MRAKLVGPGFRACNLFKLGFIGLLLCLSVGFGWKKLRNDSVDDNITDDHDDDLGTNAISVFILMGKTGAGKSSFIKSLNGTDPLGRKPAVEDGIYSGIFYFPQLLCSQILRGCASPRNPNACCLLDMGWQEEDYVAGYPWLR